MEIILRAEDNLTWSEIQSAGEEQGRKRQRDRPWYGRKSCFVPMLPYKTSPSTPANPSVRPATAFRKVVHPDPGRP